MNEGLSAVVAFYPHPIRLNHDVRSKRPSRGRRGELGARVVKLYPKSPFRRWSGSIAATCRPARTTPTRRSSASACGGGARCTLARLLRCNPWGTSGLDYVPPALPPRAHWYCPGATAAGAGPTARSNARRASEPLPRSSLRCACPRPQMSRVATTRRSNRPRPRSHLWARLRRVLPTGAFPPAGPPYLGPPCIEPLARVRE